MRADRVRHLILRSTKHAMYHWFQCGKELYVDLDNNEAKKYGSMMGDGD